ELIEEVRPAMIVSRPIYRRAESSPAVGGVRLGQRVRHGKFGEGIVLNSEGSGAHARVQVNFEHEGTKWLVVAYANLELMCQHFRYTRPRRCPRPHFRFPPPPNGSAWTSSVFPEPVCAQGCAHTSPREGLPACLGKGTRWPSRAAGSTPVNAEVRHARPM